MADAPVSREALRLFLALPLHEFFLTEISEINGALRGKTAGVKWSDPEQFHMTLHFFGDTPGSMVGPITESFGGVVSRFRPMSVRMTGVDGFPDLNRPRVIWVGIEDANGDLAALQNAAQREMKRLGFEAEERPFKPHATIGRVKDPKDGPSISNELFKIKTPLPTPFKVIPHAVLYQSVLLPSGPRYEILKDFPFPAAS